MTSYDEDYTGIAILDACPDTGTCIDFSTLGFGTFGSSAFGTKELTGTLIVSLSGGVVLSISIETSNFFPQHTLRHL